MRSNRICMYCVCVCVCNIHTSAVNKKTDKIQDNTKSKLQLPAWKFEQSWNMVLISKSYIYRTCACLFAWAYAGDSCLVAIDALQHAHRTSWIARLICVHCFVASLRYSFLEYFTWFFFLYMYRSLSRCLSLSPSFSIRSHVNFAFFRLLLFSICHCFLSSFLSQGQR